jgi:iron complex outermembrane receptor protein
MPRSTPATRPAASRCAPCGTSTTAVSFTSITAWRFWDWKPENDRDYTGLPIVSASNNPSQQDQYSQEFRYTYGGDNINVVAGAFAFKQRIDTQGLEQQGAAASRWNLTNAGRSAATSSTA